MNNMRILLKKDVKNLGFVGDVVKVKKGFARNHLFPKDLALEVSERRIHEINHFKLVAAAKIKKLEKDRVSQAESLSGTTLTFTRACDEKGNMFGSVTAFNISTALEAEANRPVGKKSVSLEAPIKVAGEHKVEVLLGHGAKAEVCVKIELDYPKMESEKSNKKKVAAQAKDPEDSEPSKDSDFSGSAQEDSSAEDSSAEDGVVDSVEDSAQDTSDQEPEAE